jgi:hypothetical protein
VSGDALVTKEVREGCNPHLFHHHVSRIDAKKRKESEYDAHHDR